MGEQKEISFKKYVKQKLRSRMKARDDNLEDSDHVTLMAKESIWNVWDALQVRMKI